MVAEEADFVVFGIASQVSIGGVRGDSGRVRATEWLAKEGVGNDVVRMSVPFRPLALLLALVSSVFGADAADGWGYGYDSLRADLERWKGHPDVRIDSFGASVQGRGLWMVSVTDGTDSAGGVEGREGSKRRIVVHARTHPSEVQAFHVAREMIAFLLDTTAVSRALRRDFQFHFVPQANPDGVELGLERTNANGVDLESNWSAVSPQPEVVALRRLFQSLMAGTNPVEVALNLHSDRYNGKRFFVFHLEAGTSWIYTEEQKRFIGTVQGHFPSGIQNWDFLTSWATGTATRYPEGFWWTSHREAVLALTYEDDNSPTAGKFDSSARALVLGATDFLEAKDLAVQPDRARTRRLWIEGRGVRIRMEGRIEWRVVDLSGRSLGSGVLEGEGFLPWESLPRSGVRVLSVRGSGRWERLVLPTLSR